MITQERLKKLLIYNEKTGVFTWVNSGGNKRKNLIAGSIDFGGYLNIGVDGRHYKAHRLAILYVRGYLPENDTDHVNRIKTDNRISNLREVSRSCNNRNSGNHKNNTSGVKGVYRRGGYGLWIARINIVGKYCYIKSSVDFVEAVAHRLAVEQCFDFDNCDSSSPAFQYMEKHLKSVKL